jgi:hypothetical protein
VKSRNRFGILEVLGAAETAFCHFLPGSGKYQVDNNLETSSGSSVTPPESTVYLNTKANKRPSSLSLILLIFGTCRSIP